jgi:hypothetical protein
MRTTNEDVISKLHGFSRDSKMRARAIESRSRWRVRVGLSEVDQKSRLERFTWGYGVFWVFTVYF